MQRFSYVNARVAVRLSVQEISSFSSKAHMRRGRSGPENEPARGKVVREIIPLLKGLGAEGIIEYPLNELVY